jgi:spore coat polysaccharide biosynthesis predicted glycosyltransferase SpsG
MGGVDKDNVTSDVLVGLEACGFERDMRVTVVMGAAAPWIDDVKRRAERMTLRSRVLVDASNMAELMWEADLAIGAAGSTSWERCCMGMPTIQVVLAENQTGIASALEAFGAAISLSREKVRFEVNSAVVNLLRDSNMVAKISSLAARIVDGKGVGRVATLLAKAAA